MKKKKPFSKCEAVGGVILSLLMGIGLGGWWGFFLFLLLAIGSIGAYFEDKKKFANLNQTDLDNTITDNSLVTATKSFIPNHKSSKIISFTYENAQGEISHRNVHVDSVDDTYIDGFCYSAEDTRTFRLDRIVGLIEQNGEFYLVDEWLEKQGIYPKKHQAIKTESPLLEICFTGFAKKDREHLETLAEVHDFRVRKTVSNNLDYLVIGSNAGESKIAKAVEVGALIINEAEFHEMVETGEIPE